MNRETVDGACVPSRNPDFVVAGTGQGIILARSGTPRVVLNQSAGLVWSLCDGEKTIAEIAELLSEAYPESGETISEDVVRIVRELFLQGILEFSSEKKGSGV